MRTSYASPHEDAQSPITISADHFRVLARQTVSRCSSQVYILVSQPGVHVTDFTANTVPYLRKVVKNAETKITADYGHGEIDVEDISLLAQEKCQAESTYIDARRTIPFSSGLIIDAIFPVFEPTNATRIITIQFGELPESLTRRKSHLSDNGIWLRDVTYSDAFLLSIMTSFPNAPNYTLIYTSSPSSHIKSHRRAAVILTQDDSADTTEANAGGLFQHYQFFTPAIYMG